MTHTHSMHTLGAAFVVALVATAPVEAQLANASAATLAQGGNAVATARGFAAIASNPAGLGMTGNPGFSLALAPVYARTGLGPVTLSDLKDVEGQVVSPATKEDWLSRIAVEGGQTGSVGARVSALALSAGRIGFQLSTLVSGRMSLSSGVAEAILYGNAGRTGEATDLEITGSTLDGYAVTTAGLSLGLPIAVADGELAVGATLKGSVGHALVVAQGSTGRFQSDPLRVDLRFPMVLTGEDDVGSSGSGVGLDVGVSLRRDRLSAGASVSNIVNTFSWDTGTLRFREGTAVLEEGNNASDFDEQPYANAPAALQSLVDDKGFQPAITLGAAYDVSPTFRVMGDLRNRFGEGLDVGPDFQAGVGGEFRALSVLALRAGAAVITDGVQFGGGGSLVLGPVNLSMAVARQQGDLDDSTIGQFTLSFGAN
ncbi:MAG: conjugal transfer protein TraF [Longimicrobiales bacterium]